MNENANNVRLPSAEQGLSAQPKRSWLNILYIIVAIIVLVILLCRGALQYRYSQAKDIASFDVPELALSKIDLPESDNAYFDLQKAKNALVYPDDEDQIKKISDIIDGDTWDALFVEKIISDNLRAIELYDSANIKIRYQNPDFSNPSTISADTPVDTKYIRALTNLKALQSLDLLKHNKPDQALNGAISIIEIAQKQEDSQASMIDYLVSVAMKTAGVKLANQILDTDPNFKLSETDKTRFSKLLQDREGLKLAHKLSYYFFTKEVDTFSQDLSGANDRIDTNLPKNIYYFEPNKTKKEFADFTKEQIDLTDRVCDDSMRRGVPDYAKIPLSKYQLFEKWWSQIWEENAIGEILVQIEGDNAFSIQSKRCNLEELEQETYLRIQGK